MGELSREYVMLFNAISDVRDQLAAILQELAVVQQNAEELYIGKNDE